MPSESNSHFIYIGYPKSASTFIGHFLRQHSDVTVGRIRLQHLYGTSATNLEAGIAQDASAGKTDVKINEKIAESICVIGDSDLWNKYKFVPGSWDKLQGHVVLDAAEAAKRLKLAYPSARVFFTIREQVDWLHSSYKFFMPRLPAGQASFADFCRTPRGLAYLEAGYYDRTIKAYVDAFGGDRVLVLRYEDINNASAHFVSRLSAFLRIAEQDLPDIRANEGSTPQAARIRRVAPFIDRLPAPVRRLGKSILSRLPFGRESVLSEAEVAALRERYADSNKRTAELLARQTQ